MNRRQFVAAGAVAALAPALPAGEARAVSASESCYYIDAYRVRCTTGFARVPAMPPQPCRALCWATCLAYMLRGYGARIDLADVLARYGLPAACGWRDDRRLLLDAAGPWTDAGGREFLVRVTPHASLHEPKPRDPEVLDVLERLARQPVLCGAAGHTTLITDVAMLTDAMGGLHRERITVADPWTATPPVRDLGAEELEAPFWVLGLSIRAL